MKYIKSSVRNILYLSIFILFIIILSISVNAITIVNIYPTSQTITTDNFFNINVTCIPDKPIKSFEIKISYNPYLLKVNTVSEGNIFDGYSTFFNPGIIDNNAGTIINIYGLIIGKGNTTNPGSLIMLNCTAKETTGLTYIDLFDVGITDETEYFSISVTDGQVTVEESEDQTNEDEEETSGDGGFSGGGGGGSNYPDPLDDDTIMNVNNPPKTPKKPSGPTFIEKDVTYIFSSSTYDNDSINIRYRFDWGDGSYSIWTGFNSSNITIYMSHSWEYISSYDIRVIAQDENGTNSSWSDPLKVFVSEDYLENLPPIADFKFYPNNSKNLELNFNASDSFDINGNITMFYWDFGDGFNSSIINPSHLYKEPGEYTVVLTVTDNNNISNSKSIVVRVGLDSLGKYEDKINSFNYLYIGILIASIIGILVFIFFIINSKLLYFKK